MSARELKRVADVLCRADAGEWRKNPQSPADMYVHMAEALQSAGMVMSPETAAELAALRELRDALADFARRSAPARDVWTAGYRSAQADVAALLQAAADAVPVRYQVTAEGHAVADAGKDSRPAAESTLLPRLVDRLNGSVDGGGRHG
ncbi:hypothetical protein AB0M28_13685 [Streptomyces sp. NPDC051940]|uniref:hypothetical protein n=1 Tax=Streptomyces sp. NPDC051940 TaxID=3155675 RepID=UPI00343AB73A